VRTWQTRSHVVSLGFEPRQRDYLGYVQGAVSASQKLKEAGLTAEAVRVLEELDESRLGALHKAMRSHVLAGCRFQSGDRDAARKELSRISRPVSDLVWEDAVASFEALIAVLDGDPREAEARARPALARAARPELRGAWQSVLAHALAAQGSREEAKELLREIRAALGPESLARIVRHQGAASPIAAMLQAESGAPYR
jgi:hypothetical protein